MKKALCILAAAAMVICGATSCKKTCKCTTTLNGKVVAEQDITVKGNCSKAKVDMSAWGDQATFECK